MKLIKIAETSENIDRRFVSLERSNRDLDKDIRDITKDHKKIEEEIKDIKKDIKNINETLKELNLGNRVVYQQKTIFNSLQRKMERMETLEAEWGKFKKTLEDKVEKKITEKDRASVDTKK